MDDYFEPDLNFMSLCCKCVYLEDEPGYCATCYKYPGMPATMFGRKKKCKFFKDWWDVPIPDEILL